MKERMRNELSKNILRYIQGKREKANESRRQGYKLSQREREKELSYETLFLSQRKQPCKKQGNFEKEG